VALTARSSAQPAAPFAAPNASLQAVNTVKPDVRAGCAQMSRPQRCRETMTQWGFVRVTENLTRNIHTRRKQLVVLTLSHAGIEP